MFQHAIWSVSLAADAPETWQRTMNQLVEGLAGTEVIHDDFLIVGCGTTDEEAEIDHDKNLR